MMICPYFFGFETKKMSDTVFQILAVSAAIVSGVVNAVGYTVQRHVLLQTTTQYLLKPVWWIGFALLIISEALGGFAFALMPASVVVALSSFSILANAFFARFREPPRLQVNLGSLCILIGSVNLGMITPIHSNSQDVEFFINALQTLESVIYQMCVLLVCIVLHLYLFRFKHKQILLLALYASLVSSITALWFRPLVAIVVNGNWISLTDPLFYVAVVIVAVTGSYAAAFLEPAGLGMFLQSEWIPVHFVFCLLVFGTSGEIVYKDWYTSEEAHPRVFIVLTHALICIIYGVALITRIDTESNTQRSTVSTAFVSRM